MSLGSTDRDVLLLAALALDAALGDPPALWRHVPHPVAQIGWVINQLDRRLNRARCSPAQRRRRGALVALGLTASAMAMGLAVSWSRTRWPSAWVVELLLVWTMLAQRSLFDHVRAVATSLRRMGLAGGRVAVARIVGRDVESLDVHGVARAAIESCAESFADGVVAPVFWYALLGLPGLLAIKTINTMDSMIGHRTDHYRDFGKMAARLDDAMNFVPARLAGLLLSLSALFVPRGRPRSAWRVMWRDHRHHASPNAGWPESAMAGAFDLALAGPRRYGTVWEPAPWIGDGRAQATVADIGSSLALMTVACFLEAGFLALLVALSR